MLLAESTLQEMINVQVFVLTCFQFIWVNIKEYDSHGKSMFGFEKLTIVFQKFSSTPVNNPSKRETTRETRKYFKTEMKIKHYTSVRCSFSRS